MALLGRKSWINQSGNRLLVDTVTNQKLMLDFVDGLPLKLELAEDDANTTVGMGYVGSTFRDVQNLDAELPDIWVNQDGEPLTAKEAIKAKVYEQHVLLRIPREPGQEYFWIAAPVRPDAPQPKTKLLAPGVVQIENIESKDTVFIFPEQTSLELGDLTFSGRVGVLRQWKDGQIDADLLSGYGFISYRGKTLTERSDSSTLQAAVTPNHAELKPGLNRATSDGATEWIVNSEDEIEYAEGDVHIRATRAHIVHQGDHTHITVPEGHYADIKNRRSCRTRFRQVRPELHR